MTKRNPFGQNEKLSPKLEINMILRRLLLIDAVSGTREEGV